MKTCAKCRIAKPRSEFYGDKRKPDGLRYDCKECVRRYQREFQHRHKQETGRYYSGQFRYERMCETCGAVWWASSNSARYCSRGCANSARGYEHTCEECGVVWTNSCATSRYCSRRCAGTARTTKEIQRWKPQPWWARHIWLTPAPTRRWFAGRCRRCDSSFVSDQPENRYCSRSCLRADSKDRRRARKKDAYVSDVYRKKIFERDKWVCQLCHRKVNRRVKVPHPSAPVLDHIIPLASRGTHEPANVQCAHFLCNSVKGDRGGGEQLLLIG